MTNWKVSELVEFLEKLKTLNEKNDKIIDTFCEVCGDTAFDSPIIEAGWIYADLAIRMGEKYFNDTMDNIDWFIHENNFGLEGLEINDEPIKSISDFVDWFVMDSRDQLL